MTARRPAAGATRLEGGGTAFAVWAPAATRVDLQVEGSPAERSGLDPAGNGWFLIERPDLLPGTRYRYLVDGQGPWPDPASRFQPEGVHGPSEVVDHSAYKWTDADWTGVPLDRLVLYELHVGTFTPEGTFRSTIPRLPWLVDLGVTAIELMPVADFPGRWNWGYDGVQPYAPARCYGRPDDLRALVDAAHGLGLAVHLDVVYNHLGPDGAYQGCFSPQYYSTVHQTPWGPAINFDGPGSEAVREYVVENALHWIREYHIDGLRLDATHAIIDDSPRHILAELAERVHLEAERLGRDVLVIAEDVRNLAHMAELPARGGWGLDALWSDDFHHEVRRGLAGDADGYFADFTGTTADIAATATRGWFYTGQDAEYFGAPRGTDPSGLPPARMVFFIQNHDQVGNRALGDRLARVLSPAAFRAATALLLTLPETPLLFMGQEWGAGTPFLFFTDHHAELGQAVRHGRREEFARFEAFRDPRAREAIPDPQAPQTFESSRLDWSEPLRQDHRGMVKLHRRLLALRRSSPGFGGGIRHGGTVVEAVDDEVIVVRGPEAGGTCLLAVIRLRGEGPVELTRSEAARLGSGESWQPLFSTEDGEFAPGAVPPAYEAGSGIIRFAGPGGAILQRRTG